MLRMALGLVGGVALLMFGVRSLGDALERAAGDLLRRVLAVITGTTWRACLTGTVLTALIQSSTAVTVLTVSLVNAGLLSLAQAVGVIYGANIGTTVTAQLMAFRLSDYALPIVAAGLALNVASRSERLRQAGRAVLSGGLMFLGMRLLHAGVPLIEQSPVARSLILTYGSNPLAAVAIGAIVTMLVASSATTVGLTMVLARAGLLGLTGAIGLMLGDNIGTCITAQLASLGASTAARRTAWAHTLYNVIGVLLTLAALPLFTDLIARTSSDITRQIANSHTLFNVLSAVVFLPISRQYVGFLTWLVPERRA